MSLKKALELLPALRTQLAGLQAALLAECCSRLADPRFAVLQTAINNVLHADATAPRAAVDAKIQVSFAVKPGLDGLLDVARRTYAETIDDIHSAALP